MLNSVFLNVEPEPATPDELYETYRKGLIQRHICLNGRLDQVTWLREFDPKFPGETWFQSRLLQNRRSRREKYIDPNKGGTPDADFHWHPMYHESADPSLVPVSRGGGDNPLLHGGLALAVFSLESSLGVTTQASMRYAHQLFGYMLECEIPGDRRGCLLRKNSAGIATELASLDEMLGVCIGLLFYVRSLDALGEVTRARQVRDLAKRMAKAMDAHGFWLLPFADDLELAKRSGWLSADFTPEMGTVVGFMFAYPFKRLFRAMLGSECPSMNCHWSGSEFKRYFPEYWIDGNNIMDKKWMLIAQAVEKAEPTTWDYVQNTLVGASVGLILGGPIGATIGGLLGFGGTAAADVNLEWDEKNFFVNTLKLAENYFDPGENAARRAFRTVVDACGVESSLDENFFNLDLLAMASILTLECEPTDDEIRNQVGLTFGTLMESFTITERLPSGGQVEVPVGRYNAVFGLLAHRGRHHHSEHDSTQESKLEQEAIGILRRWPDSPNPTSKTFQHDLPLARFPLIELLQQTVGLEQVSIRPGFGVGVDEYGRRCRVSWMRGLISRLIGDGAADWWENLRAQRLPGNFNPSDQWGNDNCWQHKWWPDSCTAFERPSHVMFGQTWKDTNLQFAPKAMTAERLAADLTDERFNGLAITMEGDGLELLFPSMLSALWGIAPVPTLRAETRETLWPTLPYLGASPAGERLGGFYAYIVDDHRGEPGLRPQKALVALRRKNTKKWLHVTGSERGLRSSESPPYPPLKFGGEYYIVNERFRGTRRHRYREVQPKLRLALGRCSPDWNFYVELADRKSLLLAAPAWQPASTVAYDHALHLVRSRVRGNEDIHGEGLLLDEIETDAMLSTLDSSIFFWCVHARMPIPYESVGNEAFEFCIVGSRPLWWRQGTLPPETSRCHLFWNPHQGTIHDVSNQQASHWNGALRTFDALWLPLTRSSLNAQPDLNAAMLSMLTTGELGNVVPGNRLHLRGRKVYFEASERRLARYNSTHPAQQERHEEINRRHVRWCSHCRHCST